MSSKHENNYRTLICSEYQNHELGLNTRKQGKSIAYNFIIFV